MQDKVSRVAIIDNALDHSIYTPVDHWSKHLPCEADAFRASQGELPDVDAGAYSHLILTGSEASIVDREPWAQNEVRMVQRAVARGLSVLGSCYGHQLLALSLAGPRCVRRCADPEVGWLPIRITSADSLLGESGAFFAFTLHFDEVVDPGPDFLISAETSQCRIHGFQYKDLPVWGIQSHPEIDIPDGRRLFENLIAQDHPTADRFRAALASTAQDSRKIRRILRVFLASAPS
jgi:GMP synthase-like glutamine amidotransferase